MDSDDLMAIAENKYNRLLVCLFGFLVVLTLPERYSVAKTIGFAIFLMALLSTVRQIRPNRRWFKLYAVLIGSNLLILILWFLKRLTLDAFNYGQSLVSFVLLFVIITPILLIQKEISLTKRVTPDTLKGGIAIYLLLGLAWAAFYDALYGLNPNAFNGISALHYQADFLHFSFVTLTTVGYGDISPVTALARIAADLEAIVGVMYPSILIAYLVGLYSNHSQELP